LYAYESFKMLANAPHISRGRIPVLIFVLLAGTYAYFYQGGGSNQLSRLAMTRAIVEDHVLYINKYSADTQDVRVYPPLPRDLMRHPELKNLIYSNKAPGSSLWAVPFWAISRFGVSRIFQQEWQRLTLSVYLTTILALGLPCAGGMVVFYLWLSKTTRRPGRSLFVTLALGLGSPFFPYATMYYSHSLAAVSLFTAFAITWWLAHDEGAIRYHGLTAFLGGLLIGFGVLLEYTAVLPAILLFGYMLAVVRPKNRLCWAVSGVGMTALVLLVFNYLVSGRLLYMTYFDLKPSAGGYAFAGVGDAAFHLPRLSIVPQLLFGKAKGLLYACPWLGLGFPGYWAMKRQGFGKEALLFFSIVMGQVILITGFGKDICFWGGSWGFTCRYLIVMLPFLAAGAAFLPARFLAATSPLAFLSMFIATGATAVMPVISCLETDPIGDFILPHFRAADFGLERDIIFTANGFANNSISWNLGKLAGLQRHWQLMPLYALWCVGLFLLLRTNPLKNSLRRLLRFRTAGPSPQSNKD